MFAPLFYYPLLSPKGAYRVETNLPLIHVCSSAALVTYIQYIRLTTLKVNKQIQTRLKPLDRHIAATVNHLCKFAVVTWYPSICINWRWWSVGGTKDRKNDFHSKDHESRAVQWGRVLVDFTLKIDLRDTHFQAKKFSIVTVPVPTCGPDDVLLKGLHRKYNMNAAVLTAVLQYPTVECVAQMGIFMRASSLRSSL